MLVPLISMEERLAASKQCSVVYGSISFIFSSTTRGEKKRERKYYILDQKTGIFGTEYFEMSQKKKRTSMVGRENERERENAVQSDHKQPRQVVSVSRSPGPGTVSGGHEVGDVYVGQIRHVSHNPTISRALGKPTLRTIPTVLLM